MKILFISSGNTAGGIGSIVQNQGQSMIRQGVDLEFFTIKGKGIKGYFRSIPQLRKRIKEGNYDILHAHYSLSAFVTSFTFKKPIVVSLMGSDTYATGIWRLAIKVFNLLSWKRIIVKSEGMKEQLGLKNVQIIPNGIDFEKFTPISKKDALVKTGFKQNKKNIIFVADPNRPEKNFKLAETAFKLANLENTELHTIYNIPHKEIVKYFFAADVLLLTSKYEGSPNVIKEAMACNLPIVTTKVGDVQKIIGDTEGCYICSHYSDEIAKSLKKAIAFNGPTKGRLKINWLSEQNIANRLLNIYKEILSS